MRSGNRGRKSTFLPPVVSFPRLKISFPLPITNLYPGLTKFLAVQRGVSYLPLRYERWKADRQMTCLPALGDMVRSDSGGIIPSDRSDHD